MGARLRAEGARRAATSNFSVIGSRCLNNRHDTGTVGNAETPGPVGTHPRPWNSPPTKNRLYVTKSPLQAELLPLRMEGPMQKPVSVTAGIILAALSTSFAQATIRISHDPGGRIVDYVERFDRTRASGERVIIDGECLSACTLVVGMLPRDQVCATPRAVLGFHAAWRPTARGIATSALATQAMLDGYPANLRRWIGHRGGLTPRMILLRGRELASIVPTCGNVASAAGGRNATVAHSRVLRSDQAAAKNRRSN